MKDVDITKFFLVDFMHGTCLGTVKQLIHIWLDDAKYLVKGSVAEVDNRLRGIAPPTSMRRFPILFGDVANAKGKKKINK